MTSLPFSQKDIDRKITELRKKTYLPAALVSLVADVTSLVLAMAPEARFSDAPTGGLPQDILDATPTGSIRKQGVVMLQREKFPLDMATAKRMADKVLAALVEHAPELADATEELRDALDHGHYSLEEVCRQLLLQDSTGRKTEEGESLSLFDAWAASHKKNPSLLRFVAQCAVMPSTFAVGARLAPYHDSDGTWPHGHCPVCGGLPLMGRLKGREGFRMHACSFCGFEYRAPRMGCPFCLKDLSERADFTVCEDDPAYQLHLCEACNCYIKIADFRNYDRPYIPMLDDLASLLLDLHAEQTGLARPTLSAWGF